MRQEYFEIANLCRDDIKSRKYITKNIDDVMIKKIASKMFDYYLDNGYWEDMDSACEYYKIPKKKYETTKS
jgi:acid phosphatase class B